MRIYLRQRIEKEIVNVIQNENLRLIGLTSSKNFLNKLIPSNILSYYKKAIAEQYSGEEYDVNDAAIYTAIANHAIRTMISVIEVEKIYSGDPAMYKWKYFKNEKLPENVQESLKGTMEIDGYDKEGNPAKQKVEVKVSALN